MGYKVSYFKIKGREWLKSQVSRAFLPNYFPGYEKYFGLIADAWVNTMGNGRDFILKDVKKIN